MNDRPLGCSVFYSTLWPYGFTLKLFTFSWLIENFVCIFVDKIDNQLKNLMIIDFYRQIKLDDWQLLTNIEYYRLIDYVFDDRLWSTCYVLFNHPHFIILILSSSFSHPHFVIRILSSAFNHPHFIILILSSAFNHPQFIIGIYHPHLIIRSLSSAFIIRILTSAF